MHRYTRAPNTSIFTTPRYYTIAMYLDENPYTIINTHTHTHAYDNDDSLQVMCALGSTIFTQTQNDDSFFSPIISIRSYALSHVWCACIWNFVFSSCWAVYQRISESTSEFIAFVNNHDNYIIGSNSISIFSVNIQKEKSIYLQILMYWWLENTKHFLIEQIDTQRAEEIISEKKFHM